MGFTDQAEYPLGYRITKALHYASLESEWMDLEDFCLVWNFDFPDFYSIMVTAV